MSLSIATGLALVRTRASENQSLAVLITIGSGSDPQVSVVNACVITHPLTGGEVVAFVGRVGAKLANLRAAPRATLVFQAGWEWVAVRGPVELSGPEDELSGIGPEAQRQLMRAIYVEAGGSHPNLDEYDQVMLTEKRFAVLVAPERIWSNPSGSEHKEPGETS